MDLGAEMTVEESINLQVLHWATPQGIKFSCLNGLIQTCMGIVLTNQNLRSVHVI